MRAALSAVIAAFAIVSSLFFFRFARDTKDRFFSLFGIAFALLAVSSFLLAVLSDDDPDQSVAVYIVRLAAFAIIAAAIVRKNRE